MSEIIGKLITTIFTTETISKIAISILKWLSQQTENTLDDELVKIIEESLQES